jgi:hypothetical protein
MSVFTPFVFTAFVPTASAFTASILNTSVFTWSAFAFSYPGSSSSSPVVCDHYNLFTEISH